MNEWGIDKGKLSFVQQAFNRCLLYVVSWTMPGNIWRSRTPRRLPKNSQFEKQSFCLLAVTQEKIGDRCSPAQGRRSPGPREKGWLLEGNTGLPRVGLFNLKKATEALNLRSCLFSLYLKNKCSFARPVRNKRWILHYEGGLFTQVLSIELFLEKHWSVHCIHAVCRLVFTRL